MTVAGSLRLRWVPGRSPLRPRAGGLTACLTNPLQALSAIIRAKPLHSARVKPGPITYPPSLPASNRRALVVVCFGPLRPRPGSARRPVASSQQPSRRRPGHKYQPSLPSSLSLFFPHASPTSSPYPRSSYQHPTKTFFSPAYLVYQTPINRPTFLRLGSNLLPHLLHSTRPNNP